MQNDIQIIFLKIEFFYLECIYINISPVQLLSYVDFL